MKDIDARVLYETIFGFGWYSHLCEVTDSKTMIVGRTDSPLKHSSAPEMALETRGQKIHEQLDALDLSMTKRKWAAFCEMPAKEMDSPEFLDSTTRRSLAYRAVADMFKAELEDRHILFLSREKYKYFDTPRQGWDDVISVLSDGVAAREIDSAGHCYALGQYTASVFHMCRLFEQGFKHFASSRITLQNRNGKEANWNEVIQKLRSYATNQTVAEEKAKAERIALKIDIIRQLWRNDCMHNTECDYNEQEAHEIMQSMHGLMREFVTT